MTIIILEILFKIKKIIRESFVKKIKIFFYAKFTYFIVIMIYCLISNGIKKENFTIFFLSFLEIIMFLTIKH